MIVNYIASVSTSHNPISTIVMGDIKSKSVQINNGAVVEGMCSQCYAQVNPTDFFKEFEK